MAKRYYDPGDGLSWTCGICKHHHVERLEGKVNARKEAHAQAEIERTLREHMTDVHEIDLDAEVASGR